MRFMANMANLRVGLWRSIMSAPEAPRYDCCQVHVPHPRPCSIDFADSPRPNASSTSGRSSFAGGTRSRCCTSSSTAKRTSFATGRTGGGWSCSVPRRRRSSRKRPCSPSDNHCDCVAVVPTRTHAVGRAAIRALLCRGPGVRGVLGAPPLARASDHAPSRGDPLASHGARTARRLDGVERRPPSPEGNMEYDRERNRDQPRSAVPGTRKAPDGPAGPGDRRGVSDCRPRHLLDRRYALNADRPRTPTDPERQQIPNANRFRIPTDPEHQLTLNVNTS